TSAAQAAAAAVKVPVIFSLSLITCFPAFFIFGLLQGSKLQLKTGLRLFAAGMGMRGAVLAGLAPLLLFFSSVGTPYAGLLIGALCAFGLAEFGFLSVIEKGVRTLRDEQGDAFKPWLVRAWTMVYLGVTSQLAWSMRPLIRHPSVTEFQLFGGAGQNENMFFYFVEQATRLFGA
ncbi:MAG TPA: hypothetical protein DEA08_38480, partial [Planctomycetes bacterium]|nr:hypothetical protein [Planctomycetota bacterium]